MRNYSDYGSNFGEFGKNLNPMEQTATRQTIMTMFGLELETVNYGSVGCLYPEALTGWDSIDVVYSHNVEFEVKTSDLQPFFFETDEDQRIKTITAFLDEKACEIFFGRLARLASQLN